MEFRISSSSIWDDTDELLSKYPFLVNFKFNVREERHPLHRWIRDENGSRIKFDDGKSYVIEQRAYITITSLSDLLTLREATAPNSLIIHKFENGEYEIEIYDDYRE